ncbi:MAG: ubiquinol-cytochrome c reductase core subunit 1 [Sclerophora amabilis]|nr:MAG: ubiquinol-cytochrome c reductase core subunit 1 [Sclerophora amabilis]
MLIRNSFSRHTPSIVRQQCYLQPSNRRGLAAAASGSFQYQTGDASGVKFASRDIPGPTTTLALVAKAGTRYQLMPGLTDGLEKFAFKGTTKRSAIRITRETELLGAELSAYHSRESLVIGAKFLRDDLPYFVELLGDVAKENKYTPHEFAEEVLPTIKLGQKALLGNTKALASNSVHSLAFHRGLGTPLHPTSSSPLTKYLNEERIAGYGSAAYVKPNIALVANGVDGNEFSKWVSEFFSDTPSAHPTNIPKLESAPSKYYGGEERISHDSGNTMIIAFPGSSSFTAGGSYKPEVAVLAALLGGETSIKWSPGFSLLSKSVSLFPGANVSTSQAAYSDAGLLCVTFNGSAKAIKGASEHAIKAIKSVASGEINKEDLTKATAAAKFRALEAGQNVEAGLELTGAGLIQGGQAFQIDEVAKSIDSVSADQVQKMAKSMLDGKASVSTVGDLYVLPYAEEIGLNI